MRIEMAFGQLKQRFQALRKGIRLKLDRVCPTIMCCFVLHNFCKEVNYDVNNQEGDAFANVRDEIAAPL